MAVTNEMIIMTQAQKLAEEGKIRYTGKVYTMETTDGEPVEIRETEPIHTFARWKAMGYKVRKGEKAVGKFPIWKAASKKKKGDDDDGAPVDIKMFMKVASFFSAAQVDPAT